MASNHWFARSLKSRSGLLQWLLMLAAVGFIAWMLARHGAELRAVFKLTPRLFILISLSCFGTFILNGVELKVLSGRFDRHIPMNEAMLLGLMVSTLNYLPMKTGTVLNGVVLRARYKLALSHFTALIAGSSVIHLWVCGVLAGGSLLIAGDQPGWGLLFLVAPTAVVAGLMIWGRMRESGRYEGHDSRMVRVASRAVDGMGEMFSDTQLLVKDVAINVGLVTLWATRVYWAFESLGQHAGFGQVLTVTALGILFTRLSIIPGGMGFREAGAAFGSAITGLPANVGFASAVVDRAVMMFWLLVVGVPATVYFLRLTGVSLDDAVTTAPVTEAGGTDGAV